MSSSKAHNKERGKTMNGNDIKTGPQNGKPQENLIDINIIQQIAELVNEIQKMLNSVLQNQKEETIMDRMNFLRDYWDRKTSRRKIPPHIRIRR